MPRLLLLALLVLLPRTAHALPWWVDDEQRAQQTRSLLDDLWPGHPIEVVVGAPAFAREGVSWDGAELTLVALGRVRSARTVDDPATHVGLVRSWFLQLEAPRSEILPQRATKARPGPWAALSLGGGARLPAIRADLTLGPGAPVLALAIEGGVALPALRFGLRASGALGERAGDGSSAVSLSRLHVGATAALVGAAGPIEVENTLGFGARVAFLRAEGAAQAVTLPSFSTLLRLFGRTDDGVRVGGGLGLGIDTSPLAVRTKDDELTLLSPLSLHAEVTIGLGGTRTPKEPWERPRKNP
jgi:hypothetical protein